MIRAISPFGVFEDGFHGGKKKKFLTSYWQTFKAGHFQRLFRDFLLKLSAVKSLDLVGSTFIPWSLGIHFHVLSTGAMLPF